MASFLRLMRRDRASELTIFCQTFEIGLSGNRYPIAGTSRSAIACSGPASGDSHWGSSVGAAGTPLPLQGHEMRVAFDIEGRRAAPPVRPRADMAIVTPGYFAAMGIPLLKGARLQRPGRRRGCSGAGGESGVRAQVLSRRRRARQARSARSWKTADAYARDYRRRWRCEAVRDRTEADPIYYFGAQAAAVAARDDCCADRGATAGS